MKCDLLAHASGLSNPDLLAHPHRLAARAREDTAEMVAHLAELESRQLYLGEGYGSLFEFCTGALRLSEHAAYNRMVAARLARQFPAVLAGIASGSHNLTNLRLLASHLTIENHVDLLAEAAGRTKREIALLVAQRAPQPDVPSSVRKVTATAGAMACFRTEGTSIIATVSSPEGTSVAAVAPVPERASVTGKASVTEEASRAGSASSATVTTAAEGDTRSGDGAAGLVTLARTASPIGGAQGSREVVAPLSGTRYRVQFTIGLETYEDLRQTRDLLRRDIPSGDLGEIFARALRLLRQQVAKEKTAATSAPRPSRPAAAASRHIPSAVKRAVWLRDRGQCAFVGRHGHRCGEQAFLELHHRHPFALGGESTAANIALRCRRHNAYEAELDFGARAAVSPAERGARPTEREPLAKT